MIDPELLGPQEHTDPALEAKIQVAVFGEPPEEMPNGSYEVFRDEECAHEGCPDYGVLEQQKGRIVYFNGEVTFEFECYGCSRDNFALLQLVDYDPEQADEE
jgi:hypothetical protein